MRRRLSVIFTSTIAAVGFATVCPVVMSGQQADLASKQAGSPREARPVVFVAANSVAVLKSLRDVYVIVERLGPDEKAIEGLGLTVQKIQTDVEIKLREAGVTVRDINEMPKRAGTPMFVVSIDAWPTKLPPSDALYVSHVIASFRDEVELRRNPQVVVINATTWEKRNSLWSKGSDFSSDVRSTVKDSLDLFVNDFLKANPKKVE